MVSLEDFQFFPFEKKCDVVVSQSSYITSRSLGNCKVYLYHTGKYFIEVYYSPVYKKVLMIDAFNEVAGLMPYVDRVSLGDLKL